MCSYIFLLIAFFISCSTGNIKGALIFLGLLVFMIYRNAQKKKNEVSGQIDAEIGKNGDSDSELKKEEYIKSINEQKLEMKRKLREFEKPSVVTADDSFELKVEDLVDMSKIETNDNISNHDDDQEISLELKNDNSVTTPYVDKKFELPTDPFAQAKKEDNSPSSNWHLDDGFDARDTFNAKDTFGKSDSFGSFGK